MKRVSLIFLLLLTFIATLPIQAQNNQKDPEVFVMHTTVNEDDGLDTTVYFTVRDELGRPVAPNKIESAKILLREDRDPAFATLEDPKTPIKIAFVMDESGSMQPFVNSVRKAAVDALSKAPANAEFAIFTFNDLSSQGEYAPGIDFTTDRGALTQFINEQYNSESLAPTCLYTAAFKATEYLKEKLRPEDRRALILFTDGKDERADGSQCSDRSIDEVTSAAVPSDFSSLTPLYTIGLCTGADCSNLDPFVLDRIATQTNAISRVGPQQQIANAFFLIMDDIRSQKVARALVLPCEERQATLLVSVIGIDAGDGLRGVIPLPTHKCYAPAGSAQISDFKKGADNLRYNFKLNVDNGSPVSIEQVEIRVLGPSNTSVYSQTLREQIETREARDFSIEIPTANPNFNQRGTYRVQVLARSADQIYFRTGERKRKEDEILATYEFAHEPPVTVQVSINTIPVIDYTKDMLVIDKIQVTDDRQLLKGKESFVKYQLLIFDGETPKFQSQETFFDIDKPLVEIPLASLPKDILPAEETRRYRLAIKVIAPENLVAQSEPLAFDFPPRPTQSFFQKYGLYCLGLLLLVVVAAVVVYFLRNRRTNKAPPIPLPYNPPTVMVSRPQGGASSTPAQGGRPSTPAPHPAGPQPGYPQPGYQQTPPSQPGYPQPGYPQPGYQQTPPSQPGYPQPGYQQTPPSQPGYPQPGAPPPGYAPHQPVNIPMGTPSQPTNMPGGQQGNSPNIPTVIYSPGAQPQAALRLSIKVVQTPDASQKREQIFSSFPVRIGRGEVQFVITGDDSISRAHAEVTVQGNEYFISDLNSKNGVFIGDMRIEPNRPVRVPPNAFVRVGLFTYIAIEPQ